MLSWTVQPRPMGRAPTQCPFGENERGRGMPDLAAPRRSPRMLGPGSRQGGSDLPAAGTAADDHAVHAALLVDFKIDGRHLGPAQVGTGLSQLGVSLSPLRAACNLSKRVQHSTAPDSAQPTGGPIFGAGKSPASSIARQEQIRAWDPRDLSVRHAMILSQSSDTPAHECESQDQRASNTC